MQKLIDKLHYEKALEKDEFIRLLKGFSQEDLQYLHTKSRSVADSFFGRKIYIRGLIEITNHCNKDCYYCGIRRSNLKADHYRLGEEEILSRCEIGYRLDFEPLYRAGRFVVFG